MPPAFQRRLIAAGVILNLGLAAPGFAQTSPPSPGPLSKAEADVAIMAYYPAKARAAGIEGAADLKCSLSDQARLLNCTVITERPSGYGFGDAALALSKLSQDNPDVPARPRPNGQKVTFSFRLTPPLITPNTLVPTHFNTTPVWTRRPSGEDFAAVYPPRAQRNGVSGRADIRCTVTVAGDLSACTVIDETPSGWNFGAAALSLSSRFHLTPPVRDGEPSTGVQIQIPMIWRLP